MGSFQTNLDVSGHDTHAENLADQQKHIRKFSKAFKMGGCCSHSLPGAEVKKICTIAEPEFLSGDSSEENEEEEERRVRALLVKFRDEGMRDLFGQGKSKINKRKPTGRKRTGGSKT